MKILEIFQEDLNIIDYIYQNLNNNPLEKSLYRKEKLLLIQDDRYFLTDNDIEQNHILINKLLKYEKEIVSNDYIIRNSQNTLSNIIQLINKIQEVNNENIIQENNDNIIEDIINENEEVN